MQRLIVVGGGFFGKLLAFFLAQKYHVIFVGPPGLKKDYYSYPRFSLSPVDSEGYPAKIFTPDKIISKLRDRLTKIDGLGLNVNKLVGYLLEGRGNGENLAEFYTELENCEVSQLTGEAVQSRQPLLANFVDSVVEIRGIKQLVFKGIAEATVKSFEKYHDLVRGRTCSVKKMREASSRIETLRYGNKELEGEMYIFTGTAGRYLNRKIYCRPERELVMPIKLSGWIDFSTPVLTEKLEIYPRQPGELHLNLVNNFTEEGNCSNKIINEELLELMHEACELLPFLYEQEFQRPQLNFNWWSSQKSQELIKTNRANYCYLGGFGRFGLLYLEEAISWLEEIL